MLDQYCTLAVSFVVYQDREDALREFVLLHDEDLFEQVDELDCGESISVASKHL